MLTHTQINAELNSPVLSEIEKKILISLINICSEKIKSQFPVQDKIYVPEVTITDIFKNNNIASKRQSIILKQLEDDADESGWDVSYDNEGYYVLKAKK